MIKKKYPSFKISIKDFWNWQNTSRHPIIINKNEVVNSSYIEKLCKMFPVYVVSNSSPNHIKYYMKQLNIKPSWFVSIISNHFTAKDKTKKHYYQNILEKESCQPENVYVFGDNIVNDLSPATNLGMNTYHITNANDIPHVMDKALNIKL